MSVSLRATAIIVAGGKGVRMGVPLPAYIHCTGVLSLAYAAVLETTECISSVILVVAADDMAYRQQVVLQWGLFQGATRCRWKRSRPFGARRS